jgi:hypothetical protein
MSNIQARWWDQDKLIEKKQKKIKFNSKQIKYRGMILKKIKKTKKTNRPQKSFKLCDSDHTNKITL